MIVSKRERYDFGLIDNNPVKTPPEHTFHDPKHKTTSGIAHWLEYIPHKIIDMYP